MHHTSGRHICKLNQTYQDNVFLCICSCILNSQTNKYYNKYCTEFKILLSKKGNNHIIVDQEDLKKNSNHLQNELIQDENWYFFGRKQQNIFGHNFMFSRF